MKFAVQLTSIMLIVVVLAVATAGISSFTLTKNVLEKNIGDTQQELAKETIDKIDRILFQKYQEIQVIAEMGASENLLNLLEEEDITEAASSSSSSSDREILQEHQFLTGPWDLILLTNKEGQVITSTFKSATSLNPQQQTAFNIALTGKNYYSDLLRSQVTNKSTMIFAAPVRNEEDPSRPTIGVAIAEFSWPVILEVFDGLSVSFDRHVHMFNKEGIIIGTPTPHRKEILQSDLRFNSVVKEALQGKCSDSSSTSSSVFLFEGEDHPDVISVPTLSSCALQKGHLGFESLGWGILIESPQDVVFAPVRKMQWLLFWIVLLIIVLLIPLILILSNKITKPLLLLTASNKAIISGKYKEVLQQQQQQQQQQHLPDEIKEFIESRHLSLKGLVRKSELEKANRELKKLAQLKDIFLSMTSHELKSPIIPIKIQAETLLMELIGKLNKKQKISVEMILRNTDYLNNLISDVLDSSKLEANQLKMFPEKTDLKLVIEEIIQDIKPIINQKNITITSTIEKLPLIMVDVKRFRQVLSNLIGNSIKYTPPGGKIVVSAKRHNKKILVTVTDTGIGISKSMLAKIFDKFVQVSPSYKLKQKGTGLGLTICKGIVKKFGGKIWAESKGKNKGTSFYFTIPIKKGKL
jgi:signal transduction histidine kinase